MADRGPPSGTEATELWLKLTQLPRPHKEIDYPRRDPVTGEPIGKLVIWPLTEAELMSCRAAAEAYAREMLKDLNSKGDASLGYQDIYRDGVVCEFITRACRSPKELKLAAFPSAREVRAWLFPDEIAVLMEACTVFQSECGPIVSSMTEPEMDAWITRLSEGGSRLPLAWLSGEAKNDLLMRAAARLGRAPTGTGSAGSPPNASFTIDDQRSPLDLADGERPPAAQAD